MANAVCSERFFTLDDGLGVRSVEHHASLGDIDVLEVGRVLAAEPALEQAIRARASRYSLVDPSLMAPVRGIERRGITLRIAADAPQGQRLSQLLADVEFGNDTLSDEGALELAAAVVRTVAAVHALPGMIAHGAINPAHIVVRPDRSVVLTDAAFGGALETLYYNREQYWRQFGVALPMSASMHRFDRRTDVTQMAAVVLAIALRRQLRADEYPRRVAELVVEATPLEAPHTSALRMWLMQALQLHPRSVLSSAVDAQHLFAQVLAAAARNRPVPQKPIGGMAAARLYGKSGISHRHAS